MGQTNDSTRSPLVTPEALANLMAQEDCVILDATVFMPAEGKQGRETFQQAHIPGAAFFDIDDIADRASPFPHMVPTASQFAAQMGALGISNGSRIVFYDQKGIFSAPRAWWLMRLFGHEKVQVLDGGLPGWQAEGRPVMGGAPSVRSPVAYHPRLKTSLWKGMGDLLENLQDARFLVLDARSRGRFEGAAAEPRPGLPSGHIPGSRNAPFTEVLQDGQRFQSPAFLQSYFANLGVMPNRAVVSSCGSGLSACILTLAMQLAGLPGGAVYDGSWTEWASQTDTPIAAGIDDQIRVR